MCSFVFWGIHKNFVFTVENIDMRPMTLNDLYGMNIALLFRSNKRVFESEVDTKGVPCDEADQSITS
jgi:hypothetical protein